MLGEARDRLIDRDALSRPKAECIGRLTCLLRQSSASEEKASVGCPDRE